MQTERLELRPLPAAAAAARPGDRAAAAKALVAKLHPEWPQADLLDVLPLQAAATPDDERFGIWVLIEREIGLVCGDVGFMGRPGADGTIEIGYSVVPACRRLGYATEAAGAMVAWALAQPEVSSIVARCDVDNVASIRVLERLGFVRDGVAGAQLRWHS